MRALAAIACVAALLAAASVPAGQRIWTSGRGRALPLLLAACLAPSLGLTACGGEPAETPAKTTASRDAAPTPTAEATPPPTATSSHAPRARPSPTPAPTPAASASPVARPTATPTPTPAPVATATATPPPLITAAELGIREVDTAEAFAAEGLTHVRYAAGETVPWEAGLFLLDAATGAVEGWVVSTGDAVDEDGVAIGTVSVPIRLSPGNRFLLLPFGTLHDRMTGRTYQGARVVAQPPYPHDLVGWGSGSGERLVLSVGPPGTYVVVDGDMQPVAQLAGAGFDRWPDPEGRYLFAHERTELQLFDLGQAGASPLTPVLTWPLDWVTWFGKEWDSAWVVPFDGGLAVIEAVDSGTCRIARYSADGQPRTDHEYRCWQDWPWFQPFIDVSPDGRFLAIARSGVARDYLISPQVREISVYDASTGEEILRVRGAGQPDGGGTMEGSWLADSSGFVVGTWRGVRLVTLEGRWGPAPGRPAPDDPDVFFEGTTVWNSAGAVLATLEFGPPGREIRGLGITRTGWGSASDVLRVRTGIYYQSSDSWWFPPDAAIEQPPLDDRRLVEVVVDTCLNLHEAPSPIAPVLTCLAGGTVVETDDVRDRWFHVRTDDGLEGWASAVHVRLHSDGVRLE